MSRKTILITGASSGIGLATVRMMVANGFHVLATARSEADRERLDAKEGCTALPLELSDPQSIAKCADAALEHSDGHVFALFNNAAYGQVGAVEDVTPAVLRAQFEVNVFGTHDLTRRLLPAMRAARAGRIVQCSSVLGLVAAPYRGAYCASKFALEALSDSLRLELDGSGVQVALIEPGPIETRFVARALEMFRKNIDIAGSVHRETYEQRLVSMEAGGRQAFKLPPEAVAAKVLHAVTAAQPKRRYYVTTPTYVAAGLKRVLPQALQDKMLMRM